MSTAGTASFRVRLAGIEIGIITDDPLQKQYMQEYVIEEGDAGAGDAGVDGPAFTVTISQTDREEILRQLHIANDDAFTYSDSYLEFIAIHAAIAERLIDYDVLVMHGSAIAMDGEAYIFTAPSGTGKSTHSRLWRETFGDRACMINDDKPMLICHEDEVIACGTPWNGKHMLGENVAVKVRAIAFLQRAEQNHIERIAASDLFEFLYIQTYRPQDPARAVKAMELLSRICRNVAMYRLECNMEPDAATVSYDGMQTEQR